LNTTQQQCFLEAAERLNFTAAADKLYISQPALSRNISALEEELEVLLFTRRNNVLSLTPGGKIIYQWMKKSRAELDIAVQEARRANAAPLGELRLGFVDTERPSGHDVRTIAAFRSQHPEIEFSITHYPSQEIIRHLTEHSMDLAVMISSAVYGDPRLQYVEGTHSRRCMGVPITHPLASRQEVSLREFADDLFISVVPDVSPTMTRMVRRTCGAVGFAPRILEAKDPQDQLYQLEAGKGVALLVDNLYARDNPLLRFIPLTEYFPLNTVCVWDRLNTNPSIGEYLKIFKEIK
jgi:DNA-binding transcriptional LysR family regulator